MVWAVRPLSTLYTDSIFLVFLDLASNWFILYDVFCLRRKSLVKLVNMMFHGRQISRGCVHWFSSLHKGMGKQTGKFLLLLRTRHKIQKNKSFRKLLYEFDEMEINIRPVTKSFIHPCVRSINCVQTQHPIVMIRDSNSGRHNRRLDVDILFAVVPMLPSTDGV